MNTSADFPEKTPAQTKMEQTLFSAEAEGRLPHALLFSGSSAKRAEALMFALARKILGGEVRTHPDFHSVRPENKMRRISIDNILALVRKIQQSPLVGTRKVACVYEPERMGRDAANAFLKTLEEPPAGTTIFLLSGAINQVLPTVRSRCLNFRLHGNEPFDDPRMLAWLGDFSTWINALRAGNFSTEIASGIFSVYGLTSRFESLLEALTDEAWTQIDLPEDADSDQRDALREGTARGIRRRMLASIEDTLLRISLADAQNGFASVPAATKSCELLENLSGLLELNAQISAVLESFLLSCMRLWAKKAR